jgi:hypothetical protein
MPSVTSLRTAYFTCWIGPGRCVRASLNSGLICKSPTTRSKLIKSRMPNRPMSGLQRVASERNAHQCTARRAPTQIPTPGRHRPRILPRRPCQQCQWARHRNPNRRQSRSQFRGQIQPHFRQTFAGPSRRSATGPQSIDPIHKWLRLSWTSSAVYSRAGDERERKKKNNRHREPLISTRATCSGYRVYPPHPPPPWRPARGRPRLSPAGRTARCSTATARRPPRA